MTVVSIGRRHTNIHPAVRVCVGVRLCASNAYALVHGEAMVDAGWQGDQVPLVHGDADPSVLLVPDVKVGLAIQDVADLVVRVQVLREEHLQLKDTDDISPKLISLVLSFISESNISGEGFKWNYTCEVIRLPFPHSWAACPYEW